MVDLKKLIAKQRTELEAVKVSVVDVVLGGEKIAIGIRRATPDEWDLLVASCPPRPGVEGDAMIGYNPKAASRAYPEIEIDGGVVDGETWGEVYSVLDSVWRNQVETVIWGVNIQEQLNKRNELGKARAGRK